MSTRSLKKRINLSTISEEDLLDLRFCDLPIKLGGAFLNKCIRQLSRELKEKKLIFNPHLWLSDEWFSEDRVPGVAIPFYLAHPRLIQLERKFMLEAEGSSERECMKILRHEAGHAIDTAYRLRYQKQFRSIFGPISKKYPESYTPKPNSRKFVLHLDDWYAQAHPLEDFAETFAVWLRPNSRWQKIYAGWPALKKLHYVDDLMKNLIGKRPLVSSRKEVDSLSKQKTTLRKYYRKKQEKYSTDLPQFYDRHLYRIFSSEPKYETHTSAAKFLRTVRKELTEAVSDWTGLHRYTIDQVLTDVINRCKELRLRLIFSEARTNRDVLIMLTVQAINFVHTGHSRVSL